MMKMNMCDFFWMNKDIFYHLKIKYVCILKFLNQGNLWFNNCHIKKLNTSDVLQMFYADIKLPYLLLKLSSNKKKTLCNVLTPRIFTSFNWIKHFSNFFLPDMGHFVVIAEFFGFHLYSCRLQFIRCAAWNLHSDNFAYKLPLQFRKWVWGGSSLFDCMCVEYLCLRLNKAFGSSQLCGVDFWSCS